MKSHKSVPVLMVVCVLMMFAVPAFAGIIHVKPSGTGNGLSWADAANLQNALATLASSGDEIWVAAGTYKPSEATAPTTADREISFVMKEGIGIYGGFAGTETARSLRNWQTNATILSGDIGTSNDATDNSYHVVKSSGATITSTTVLDGFTITGGRANGSSPYNYGGGMYNDGSSPTITNCTFSGNSAINTSPLGGSGGGGGMFNQDSSPTITNCTFSGNSAINASPLGGSGDGGGMFNQDSSPMIIKCTFSGNSATGGGGIADFESTTTINNCIFSNNTASYHGGGIFAAGGNSTVSNCIFSGNSSDQTGGGMCTMGGNDIISNCTFYGNSSTNGGGIDIGSIMTIVNCIIWNNTPDGVYCFNCIETIDYSIIQGELFGIKFPDTDPMFVDPAAGNFRLQAGSPAIDKGNSADIPPSITTDMDGNPRISGNAVDMGAYEFISLVHPPLIYVNSDATGLNNGKNWTDAYADLQDALSAAVSGDEIWVAAGTYKPTATTDRGISFEMKNGVRIYGGFAGTETARDQRNWQTNRTVLSGNIGDPLVNTDNSYNIVNNNGLDDTAVLDGFTLTGGKADNDSTSDFWGGGMYNLNSNPTIANCIFSENSANYGGGIFNYTSSPKIANCTFTRNSASAPDAFGGGIANYNSNPQIANCTFSENSTDGLGGGISNYNSSPRIISCIFSGNSGSATLGGGMCNSGGNPTVINCIFWGNSSTCCGGGMSNFNTRAEITNCTFFGNSANHNGGGINNRDSILILTNCILWNNTPNMIYNNNSFVDTISSIVQGRAGAQDPLFINPTAGNFRLQPGSPAIDRGNNSGTSGIITDIEGNLRISGTSVDIGAYEYTVSSVPPVIPGPPLPIVIIAEASDITANEAASGGNVIYPEGCTALLVGRGVAWDTVSPPTYPQDAYTFDGWASGKYTSTLTDLVPQTKYYIRAYVMYKLNNVVYTRYSAEIYSFMTEALPGDVNGDKILDLKDAILALKIVAGAAGNAAINLPADVNEDGKIGIEEAVYVLQHIGSAG